MLNYIYTMKKTILFLIVVASFSASFAQSGWDLIKQNKLLEARAAFEKTLETDTINESALKGMILLSEMQQDLHFYKKYVTRYLRNYNNQEAYRLLDNAFKGDRSIFETKPYDKRFLIDRGLYKATQLSDETTDREKVLKEYRKYFNKWNWALLGPFKNVQGSGYIEELEPEKGRFEPNQNFIDETGDTLGWVVPPHMAGTGRVFLYQHLSSPNYGRLGTYYLNTFIEVPEDKEYTLLVARSSPIKIWLDDQLVFDSPDLVNYDNAGELVKISLKKGWHRLFVKMAHAQQFTDGYDLLAYFDWSSLVQNRVAFRLMDEDQNIIAPLNSQSAPREYRKDQLEPVVLPSTPIDYYSSIEDPDPFDHFMLCKAYMRWEQIQEGERSFFFLLKNNPELKDLTIYRYFLAKLYAANGKREKVYELLGNTNKESDPIYELEYEKLKEIDMATNKDLYKDQLDALLKISPSNYSLIKATIRFYDKFGLTEAKDSFIKKKITAFPEYEDDFESDLSTYKKETSRWTAKDDLKKQKSAYKRIRKGGNDDDDYEEVIDYFKDKKKPSKVLTYYDQYISQNPHVSGIYADKAEYLIEEDRYAEAESELLKAVAIEPSYSYAWELIGDTYEKRDQKEVALAHYKKALSLKKSSYWTSSLQKKIEKIEGTSKYKEIFNTKSFDQVLEEQAWRRMAPNEDAIILMYTKDVVVTAYNQVEAYQKFMVKLLTEAGIERWREYNFRFMGKLTSVKVVKPDGRESFPDKRGSFVVFKNLEKGDLIILEGKTEYSLGGVFDNDFTTQHFIYFPDPIYYTKLELAMPPHRKLSYKLHKLPNTLVSKDEGEFTHHTWEHRFLGRIQMEEAFPDYYDLYRSIQISTMEDWSKMVKWYQRKTYGRLDIPYDVKLTLDTLIKPGMTDQEKVVAVYNYITKEIRYSYVAFLNSRFVPKRPTNTCSAGIGDCKDVATLMIVMLRELGIKSDYCLVKTNQFNHLDIPPSMSFDHVIVAYEIDGKTHYADLTTNYYPYNVLPEMDNNAVGLLIRDGENETLRLPSDQLNEKKSAIRFESDVKLRADRGADITVNASYQGVSGATLRETLFRTPSTKMNDLILSNMGVGVFENLQVKGYEFPNKEEFSSPLQASYSFSTNGYMDKVINLFILRMPYMLGIQKSQAITAPVRTNRIDLSKVMNIEETTEVLHVSLPEGYKLIELPEDIEVSSKFGSYRVTFSRTSTGFDVVKTQQLNQKIIDLEDFESFRAFYLKLLDADKVKMAIQKK
jgi:hypothetical protein